MEFSNYIVEKFFHFHVPNGLKNISISPCFSIFNFFPNFVVYFVRTQKGTFIILSNSFSEENLLIKFWFVKDSLVLYIRKINYDEKFG